MSDKIKLQEAVKKIYEAVAEAESISNETGESFSLDIVWGMGGYYDPEEYNEDMDSHWYPSSQSC
ncbi:MAG: hypothetical protein [Caudoviricetes sp.]|nr:MAG: hypothetical protein [Caudoviricetes sp.]